VLRADGGDTAFLANHCDYIASVDTCVVRIQGVHDDERTTGTGGPVAAGTGAANAVAAESSSPLRDVIAAVHGGYVKVERNTVEVVAPVAELAEEIDVDRAKRALEAAEAKAKAAAGSDRDAGESALGDLAEAEAAAARARVRLEAANAAGTGPSLA
jgi:F0F1-type ATP synthase epsilon subunit